MGPCEANRCDRPEIEVLSDGKDFSEALLNKGGTDMLDDKNPVELHAEDQSKFLEERRLKDLGQKQSEFNCQEVERKRDEQ